ncbi:MAG TPA: aspartate-semialdehyde dehydrogenase, partial [Schnuerera sp.]|nr:aspartate-semialdehyde dehydrogenase [Schnuerera sp.]
MKKANIAVIGATGMVGRTLLKVLEERDFPIKKLYLFASAKSKRKIIEVNGKEYEVEELTENSFRRDIDIALFSAGGEISKKFAVIAKNNGAIVIDNSS